MSEAKTTDLLRRTLRLVAIELEREGREVAADTCSQAAARLRELEEDKARLDKLEQLAALRGKPANWRVCINGYGYLRIFSDMIIPTGNLRHAIDHIDVSDPAGNGDPETEKRQRALLDQTRAHKTNSHE